MNIQQTKGVYFTVRENDHPHNLAELLLDLGYMKVDEDDKMGLNLQDFDKSSLYSNDQFETIPGMLEDLLHPRLLELERKYFPNFFNSVEEVKKTRIESEKLNKKLGIENIHFITYDIQNNTPVALGSLQRNVELPKIAYLAGALTDENYRKKGIYTNLLYKRINWAKQNGIQYLI